jgi:hypothetical protein
MATLLQVQYKMIQTLKLQLTPTIPNQNLAVSTTQMGNFNSPEVAQPLLHKTLQVRINTTQRIWQILCKKKWRRGMKAQGAEDRSLDLLDPVDNRFRLASKQPLESGIRSSTKL